jgi:hypothetical protein
VGSQNAARSSVLCIRLSSSLQEAVVLSSFEIQTGAAPDQVQVLDTSVPEHLRRLARHIIYNPDSRVNGVHSTPGPSGRYTVVITIEIGNIIGDTII